MQIIGPTFKYLYSRYLKDILHDGFEVVTGNHRTAIITAKAHIEMQWEEYRKRPLLYNWLMGPGKQYVPYVLAAGYNSNNFHRAKELEDIIRNNILKTPKEIMRLFYERLYMPR
jgi:hypothetical protein